MTLAVHQPFDQAAGFYEHFGFVRSPWREQLRLLAHRKFGSRFLGPLG
ncbi:MAG: hypothetical protein IT487_17155 [Chromatiaceae bacterium]|nr:hypothetical protein [Chromatiaceae bacterium]